MDASVIFSILLDACFRLPGVEGRCRPFAQGGAGHWAQVCCPVLPCQFWSRCSPLSRIHWGVGSVFAFRLLPAAAVPAVQESWWLVVSEAWTLQRQARRRLHWTHSRIACSSEGICKSSVAQLSFGPLSLIPVLVVSQEMTAVESTNPSLDGTHWLVTTSQG